LEDYRPQNRGGKGLITYSIQEKTGNIVSAKVIDENDEIMMISFNGTIIRLNSSDISEMGRNTQGVTLMRMKDDKVVSVASYVEDYRPKNRGGKGLITYSIQEKTGNIVSAKVIDENDEIMMISFNGTIIRLNSSDISEMGRNTQGVTLMRMKDDKVVSVASYV